MEIKTIEVRKLIPSMGMVLTNGDIYSAKEEGIYLGINDSPDDYYEITKEEYEKILAKQEAEFNAGMDDPGREEI